MGVCLILRDVIVYGGQRILTIYHENEELDVPNRHWREREKIGRYWLEFEESSDHTAEEIPKTDTLTEVELLSHTHPLSPCDSHKFCVHMVRYRSVTKPNSVFLPNAEGIRIKQEEWEKLCEFVRLHTGMDLAKTPMACGDTFIFHYVQLNYHETKEGAILVEPAGFDRIDIHFKRKQAISEAQTRRLSPDIRDAFEFVPSSEWDTFDIYAYDSDKLWFYANDISFIHSLSLTINYSKDRSIQMKKTGYKASFTGRETQEHIRIGKQKTGLRLEQDYKESRLVAAMNSRKKTTMLIPKGGEHAVYKQVNNMLDRPWDEVRLFDPYLLDNSGKNSIVDWMRLLCGSPSACIRAIFFDKPKENSMNLEEVKILLSKDWPLFQEIKRKPGRLHLIGLSEYIHDRFLLCKQNNDYAGIALGTSLNSIGANWFCLHILSNDFSKECWESFDQIVRAHSTESVVL